MKSEFILKALWNCMDSCHSSMCSMEQKNDDDLEKFSDEEVHEYELLGFVYSSLGYMFQEIKEQFPNDIKVLQRIDL